MVNPRALFQTMITLATSSLGFVAALAWNDAIKALITKVAGQDESLGGLFTYAAIATALAVTVVALLGKAAAKLGGEAVITREVD